MDEEKKPEPIMDIGAQPAPVVVESPAARAARIRAEAFKQQEEERKQFHADLRKHIHESNSEQNTSEKPHPMVHEHAELRGLKKIKVLDPETMTYVDRPCWQIAALVGRFHAHGLRHDMRISHAFFEKALQEALHGPI